MTQPGDGTVPPRDSWTRRDLLRVGGVGLLTLPHLLAGRAMARPRGSFGRARSCILAFLFGAPAHQDIWDLKPDAPTEIRGEFRPIASAAPGILLGEHIPLTAAQARRFALVRSVTHPDDTHTVAMHFMLTGHRHSEPTTNPRNRPVDFPCFGAVVRHLRPGGQLPSGISLNAPANQVSANNHIFPGFFAGFLGAANDPLFVAADPSRPDFTPFPPLEDAEARRLVGRGELRAVVDRHAHALEAIGRTLDAHRARAVDLLTSSAARRAFDLGREPPRLRDRYGPSPFGQGLLLARRLVDAGVGLVTVNWARDDAYWDTHANNFNQLKRDLLPPFDRGFSALLEDLDDSGLLDETLVVCLGEFGRTPRINKAAGRDHWAACNSVVLAGAGIRGGTVLGSSDRHAAYPAMCPVTPGDLAATIYHALGIDPTTELRDHLGRQLPLATGRPLVELWSG